MTAGLLVVVFILTNSEHIFVSGFFVECLSVLSRHVPSVVDCIGNECDLVMVHAHLEDSNWK